MPKLDRVLAIGDAVRTDIAGAAAFGIDALFVGQGIHRDEVMSGGRLDARRVRDFLSREGARPIAAVGGVAW